MEKKRRLLVYGGAHLVVDLACFVLLFGNFSRLEEPEIIAAGFLFYNTLAFPTQMIFGRLFDRAPAKLPALTGCGLVAAGLLLGNRPWAAVAACGLGNALFHVGGGIDSLRYCEGRFARPGIFVAFGALGTALGNYLGTGGISVYPVVLLVLTAGFWILAFGGEEAERENGIGREACPKLQFTATDPRAVSGRVRAVPSGAVIQLCLVSVVIRSYVGFQVKMPWAGKGFLLFLPPVCAFLGKAAGGAAADRIGAAKLSAAALLISAPLLCLSPRYVLAGGLGLILFNMTMAVTAGTIYAQMPARPGFAFGLTTFGLWLGYLPGCIFPGLIPDGNAMLVGLVILSAVCLTAALSGRKERAGWN